ncbi:hypothetical protein N7456_011914, partial [Penicillium angulare]
MTQSTSHRRSPSSPHASKPKSSRPVLHRRGASAVRSISKLGAGPGHSHSNSYSHSRSVKEDDLEFDMSASFLNFCAMCENQITVPNNSILYCSESCRRKDSCKPLSASLPSMTNISSLSSTSTTPPTSPSLSPRTIVAPMTPTRPIPSIRIPSTVHDCKTDLDPTEWKPVIGRATSLASSDAWAYLSAFHGGNESLLARRQERSTSSLPALVPSNNHDGHAHAHSRVPSLTHTPSTIASSFSSDASDELSMYEASNRPLPPRHNPYFGHGTAPKGVELVTPLSENAEIPVEVVDTAEDWEDAHVSVSVSVSAHKKTAPISMVRGGGSARR